MTLSATATRLLREKGEAVAISYVTAEIRNPATGEITTAGTVTTITGYGYPGRFMSNEVDGSVIKRTDIRLVLNSIGSRPEPGWLAFLQGKSFRILDVQPVTLAGGDIIYICQLRV